MRRRRVGTIAGEPEISFSPKEIFLLAELQLRDAQARFFQAKFYLKRFNRRSEQDERIPGDRKLAAEFSFACADISIGNEFAREIRWTETKEPREVPEVIDRCRDVAAECRLHPIGQALRPGEIAA